VHSLADMLSEFPELSAQIPLFLLQDNVTETVAAGLIHALELAGNEASQQVLSEIMNAPVYQHSNRLRSIFGLSGVEQPSPASIEALLSITDDRSDLAGDDLANTALLALGNTRRTLREAGNEDYSDLSNRLGSDLSGQTREAKVVLLAAMANAKDSNLLPYAEAELEDPQDMVRTAAIDVILSVDSPESLNIMFRRLKSESSHSGWSWSAQSYR
jgi:hypothetical protein